jgi:hypothetical protein
MDLLSTRLDALTVCLDCRYIKLDLDRFELVFIRFQMSPAMTALLTLTTRLSTLSRAS